ncbi:ABC transporter permease [Devosia rhizoryzae]|uniref:ABC transporter permease n=1 Tax=Devosia rhizoryzae TaxID=2774137 RepID=A0ABX7C9B2_9HYPH|nr:ABC transporter permease [Devosia rhizoryzae]QQR40801.1 ABC transporter permease [Devosia rhizoryzae]
MTPGLMLRTLLLVVLLAFLVSPDSFAPLLQPLVKYGGPPIYHQGNLLDITLNHLWITFAATFVATVFAVGLAIVVTRPFGAEFLPLSRSIANVGQTIPPVAVLALAIPLLGFGTEPILMALFLYGLLPIFENALAGLANVPREVEEAARGMGLTPWQRLVQIELPLALPVMLTGIRIAAVISLSTATIGSTVAAKTLGEVIIAGLTTNNTAFVLQGGLIVGACAVLINDGLLALERVLARRTGKARNA